ncbi:hypothetical protein NLI96_g7639 [Meripilus lineatus]|uniref:VWFA domain-containing protein n=1 Tax=Meripilus lineatus TaxID=2056292 RepID=A0AAD5V0Z5_9APHY|nr:hypothetical protein NLI96_g7639 [Physisporinus lineatus]
MSYNAASSSQPSTSKSMTSSFPDVPTSSLPAYAPPSYGDTTSSRRDEKSRGMMHQEGRPQDTMLESLRGYDTVIIVDDSQSMSWYGRWAEARAALMAFAEIAVQYDQDGIEIRFFNSPRVESHIISADQVARLFDSVEPSGATPLGNSLDTCIRPYIKDWKSANGRIWSRFTSSQRSPKPRNFLVITDGCPTDDPQDVIFRLSVKMDKLKMPQNQVGIQLVQIGDDAQATEFLQDLDNYVPTSPELRSGPQPDRDIVDTEPYRPGERLTEEKLVKVLVGGINKRIDRRDQQSRR